MILPPTWIWDVHVVLSAEPIFRRYLVYDADLGGGVVGSRSTGAQETDVSGDVSLGIHEFHRLEAFDHGRQSLLEDSYGLKC